MKKSVVILCAAAMATAAPPEVWNQSWNVLPTATPPNLAIDGNLTNSLQAKALYHGAGVSLNSTYAPSPAYMEAAEEQAVAMEDQGLLPNAPLPRPGHFPAMAPASAPLVPKARVVLDESNFTDVFPTNVSFAQVSAKNISEPSPFDKATSLGGDETDIDSSLRERIEMDSKRVGKIAENLVGVQGDINHVEKEVLGKVFDMSSMKSFLNAHEAAIKEHEKLDDEQEDLDNQTTLLSRQLDKAINETDMQDKLHHERMVALSAQVAEDKSVVQGLQRELVPLVEMQKEVEKLPPINANQTANNTETTAAAQAATEELLFEKSKIKTYQETTKNLMKELVKQHDYATKCHTRLYQLNTQIHEVESREARMKYEEGRASAKGEQIEKFLEAKNQALEDRLKKAKNNLQTINFAKANVKSKIGALQIEAQMELEKLKETLGELKMQSASIETAMMAKISNRQLIEKALRNGTMEVEDMQTRLLAGRLDKLRRNNTQMTSDLNQIREGLSKAQINTARAEAQKSAMEDDAQRLAEEAGNKTAEAQETAREALAKVVAIKQQDDDMAQKAQEATMEAQASMLTKCSEIWDKEHVKVNKKLDRCVRTKRDLQSTKASVASLTQSLESASAVR